MTTGGDAAPTTDDAGDETATGEVAVVGAGRIGVPWGAVLADELGVSVTYVDVDPDRVTRLRDGEAPFAEPGLAPRLARAVDDGLVTATTDESAVADARFVAVTVNAERDGTGDFLDIVRSYARHLSDDQIVVSRTTIPVDTVARAREAVQEAAAGEPAFTVFPERLAEGRAVEEILTLPKVVGVDGDTGRRAVDDLLADLDCPTLFTDPETAMFVKLIDNAYRDALFAVANQIAFTADQLGLDARTAVELANTDYPRNDIPAPGPVGGKCLPKDPHFLTDERVCAQPTTPDLFGATRRTNARIPAYVATEVLRRQPETVGVLGLSYKRGVGDTYGSPAVEVAETLEQRGVTVSAHDPHVPRFDTGVTETVADTDVVLLAVNHAAFEGIEPQLNDATPPETVVYDMWGVLDRTALERPYDGFGIEPDEPEPAGTQFRGE